MKAMRAGFASADITPSDAVELAGYFNKRVSTGVLDPLQAKAVVIEDGPQVLAVVVADLVGLKRQQTEQIRQGLTNSFGLEPRNILLSATHTHTGPSVWAAFEVETALDYVPDVLVPGIESAVGEALADLRPFRLLFGKTVEEGLAFNRRYWMKDGRVMTNPPKGSPDVVGPEGPIDHSLQVYAFERDGDIAALLVDANNHTDTVGGNQISADWPGRMSKALAETMGREITVMLLNGPAGNINHFDRDIPHVQTSYEEAERIGRGYARFVLEALGSAEPVDAGKLRCGFRSFAAPYRKASPEELEWARQLCDNPPDTPEGDMTAEDLARGHPYVEWIYARALLSFQERYGGSAGENLEIGGFCLGQSGFVGLPGEPFTEIGLAIKEQSPFERTTVFALCGDVAGYVPLPEHFEHGGYEPRTTLGNRFAPQVGPLLIEQASDLLKDLHGRL